MRLSARPLLNYVNVNSFSYANQWIIRAGDPNTLYFQVVDLDQGPASVVGAPNPIFGFQGSAALAGNLGLRYMVGVGSGNQPAGINVTFPSIDDTQEITIAAVQETDDKSIWKIVLGQNQKPNSGIVRFAVTEGSATRRFSALNLISVEYPQDDGSC